MPGPQGRVARTSRQPAGPDRPDRPDPPGGAPTCWGSASSTRCDGRSVIKRSIVAVLRISSRFDRPVARVLRFLAGRAAAASRRGAAPSYGPRRPSIQGDRTMIRTLTLAALAAALIAPPAFAQPRPTSDRREDGRQRPALRHRRRRRRADRGDPGRAGRPEGDRPRAEEVQPAHDRRAHQDERRADGPGARKGMALPRAISAGHQFCAQSLAGLSGEEFDRCYAKAQLVLHMDSRRHLRGRGRARPGPARSRPSPPRALPTSRSTSRRSSRSP